MPRRHEYAFVFWNIQGIICLPAEGVEGIGAGPQAFCGASNLEVFCAKQLRTVEDCFVTHESIKQVYFLETESCTPEMPQIISIWMA
jgi:hypothetical protein